MRARHGPRRLDRQVLEAAVGDGGVRDVGRIVRVDALDPMVGDGFMSDGGTPPVLVTLDAVQWATWCSVYGIEADPTHFDVCRRRIEEAYRQPRLFDEPVPKPVQPSLLGDAA